MAHIWKIMLEKELTKRDLGQTKRQRRWGKRQRRWGSRVYKAKDENLETSIQCIWLSVFGKLSCYIELNGSNSYI